MLHNFLSELTPKGKVTSTNILFIISFPNTQLGVALEKGVLCGPSEEKIYRPRGPWSYLLVLWLSEAQESRGMVY